MSAPPRVHWTFSALVGEVRASQLLAWQSFEEIIDEFSACTVAPLYWEPATAPHLEDCHRASFELAVSLELFDGFFNAPAGYRGQYAASESVGEAANRRLIEALLPRLLRAENPSAIEPRLIEASLRGKQAKTWIVESAVEDQLTHPEKFISFPEWEFNEPDGQGLRAPQGTALEVKGAWLDRDGREVVNQAKCRRSTNIYKTGDSK